MDFKKNFLLKHDANVFIFQPYDFVNEHFIKLTKDSINLNESDLLFIPNWTYPNQKLYTFFSIKNPYSLLFLINNFLINDDCFESNYNFLTNKPYNTTPFINKNFNLTTFINYKNKLSRDKDNIDTNALEITTSSFYSYFKKPEYFNQNFLNFSYFSKKLTHTFYTPNFNSNENFNYFYKISNIETTLLLLSKPIWFKFFLFKNNINSNLNKFFNVFNSATSLYLNNYFFYSLTSRKLFNNILPDNSFLFLIKKYVIKSFNYQKFPIITAPWHYNTLIRFLEFCSGKSISVNFFSFLNNILDFYETTRCEIWAQKLKSFKKTLGPKLFLSESLKIIYTSLKLKDPYFLSSWLLNFFYKISFWKFKLVFRYLQYILRYFFWPIFKEILLKGLKFQLKGKVSVAGNARTRTVVNKIGRTGHATFNNKVLYNLNLIKTFTGVIGFKTWLVF